jgi:hypothetical protein
MTSWIFQPVVSTIEGVRCDCFYLDSLALHQTSAKVAGEEEDDNNDIRSKQYTFEHRNYGPHGSKASHLTFGFWNVRLEWSQGSLADFWRQEN